MTTYTITQADFDLLTGVLERAGTTDDGEYKWDTHSKAQKMLQSLTQNSGEVAAWIYPSDLEKFQEGESFGHAYSIKVGCPDEVSVPLYLHPAPSTKPAGWIAAKDQMPPPQVRVLGFEPQYNIVDVDMWFGPDFSWGYSYWMPLPPAPQGETK